MVLYIMQIMVYRINQINSLYLSSSMARSNLVFLKLRTQAL